MQLILWMSIPAFIAGFGVGWFAPAKWWFLYVFVGASVITLVLVMIWSQWDPHSGFGGSAAERGSYTRLEALLMFVVCIGPYIGLFSVPPATLGGVLAQSLRKRLVEGERKELSDFGEDAESQLPDHN